MISYLYKMTITGFMAAANLSWLLYRAISPTSPRLAKTSSTIYVHLAATRSLGNDWMAPAMSSISVYHISTVRLESVFLRSLPKNGTLETDLRQLAVKRSGGDICAAHDLSPLYEAILGVQWDKVKEKGTALHDQMSSLSLDGQASKAKQVVKKGIQIFNKAFNWKGGRGNGRGGGGSGRGSRSSEAL
jgi:hypothetical protein